MATILDHLVDIMQEQMNYTWRPSGPTAQALMDAGLLAPESNVRFTLDYWGAPDVADGNGCGYVACIIGHGILDERTNAALVDPTHTPATEGDLGPNEDYDEHILEGLLSEDTVRRLDASHRKSLSIRLAIFLFMPDSYARGPHVQERFIERVRAIQSLDDQALIDAFAYSDEGGSFSNFESTVRKLGVRS